jgi:hypothetical protein
MSYFRFLCEAIKMQLFPNYRKDLKKLAREKAQMRKVAAGRAGKINEAEAEEEARTGFVDWGLARERRYHQTS